MTGLDGSGVFRFYCSVYSQVKGGSGGSAVGHGFPTRELEEEGDPARGRGWVPPGSGGQESRGGRNKELGWGAVRLLKTIRGHPDVAERRKATDELREGTGRRALPHPNLPPAN